MWTIKRSEQNHFIDKVPLYSTIAVILVYNHVLTNNINFLGVILSYVIEHLFKDTFVYTVSKFISVPSLVCTTPNTHVCI